MQLLGIMASVLLASTVLATSASAVVICDQTWSEIDRSGLKYDLPKIQFDSTFVSIDGVCEKAGKLYTTSKIEICDQWAQYDAGPCIASHMQTLVTDVSYTKDLPVNEFEFRTVPMRHPLTQLLPVGRRVQGAIEAVCMKEYSIRPCPSSP